MQFLLLKGATMEKNDITRESRCPTVSLERALKMTTGRIFADNGFLGSFFSPPVSASAASLPLSSLTRFKRSPQTTKLSAGKETRSVYFRMRRRRP